MLFFFFFVDDNTLGYHRMPMEQCTHLEEKPKDAHRPITVYILD